MDGRKRHPKAVRQCRARRDPDRAGQGVLPDVEEPDRGDGAGRAFRAGRFRPRDRPGGGGVDAGSFDLTPIATAEKNAAWPLASHATLMVGIIGKVEWKPVRPPCAAMLRQRTINLASRVRVL